MTARFPRRHDPQEASSGSLATGNGPGRLLHPGEPPGGSRARRRERARADLRAARADARHDDLVGREGRRSTAARSQFGKEPTGPENAAFSGGVEADRPAAVPRWLVNKRLRHEAARLLPLRQNRKGQVVPTGLAMCRSFAVPGRPDAPPVPMELRSVVTEGGRFSPRLDGVNTCKDPACAECATSKSHEDQAELSGVVAAMREAGFRVYFGTLTIRHAMGDDFGLLRRGLFDSWDATTEGGWWSRLQKRHELLFVRRFETTFGENGHHPHLHVMFFSRGPLDEYGGDVFASEFLDRFASKVEEIMGEAHVPFGAYAFDFEEVIRGQSVAKYLTKLCSEVTSATTKDGGANPTMPFGVLARIRDLRESEGDEPSDERRRLEGAFRNWRDGSKGTVLLSYSRKLSPVRAQVREALEAEPEEREEERHTAFVPASIAPRLLRSKRVEVALWLATERGASPAEVRAIVASAFVDAPTRESALRAWDREQTRWVRAPGGAWVLRPPEEPLAFAFVIDATRGSFESRREEVSGGR